MDKITNSSELRKMIMESIQKYSDRLRETRFADDLEPDERELAIKQVIEDETRELFPGLKDGYVMPF